MIPESKMVLCVLSLFVFIIARAHTAEAGEERQFPLYGLSVSFDVKNNLLRGMASVTLTGDGDTAFSAGDLRIESIRLNGKPVDYRIKDGAFKVAGKGVLEIRYEGTFKGEQGGTENLENAGVVSAGIVSEKGISLTGNWYPSIKSLALYKLTAIVPENFTAISEADEITSRETESGREYVFHFAHPLNGIDLAAGEYREVRDRVNNIDIYMYFFPEDISLADTYAEYTKKYFRMYEELLVPYPYKRFSVVENILPTGYSMPTFTLLGRDVVRLPFITSTSLGHEITHQWFGNYVYADFGSGNWLEAITTYLSDHLYEEQKSRGWEYRKKILIDYQSYVTPGKDFPLKDFTQRTDFASASIGYGKGAMLFHMLKNLVGEETFYRSLKSLIKNNAFRNASWVDIKKSFEDGSGRDLGWFFDEWLDRKGVPSFVIKDPRVLVLNGIPTVTFELNQKGESYKLELPLRIAGGKGEVNEALKIEKEKQYFEIPTEESPRSAVFDGNYDTMRKLREGEFPPVISRLLGDEKRIVVYSENGKEQYADLIRILKENGFTRTADKDLKDETIRTSSLIILGFESPVLKRLFGEVGKPASGFLLTVKDNPLNTSKVVAYANGDTKEEVTLAARKIFHYGKYSTVRFEKGKNVEKETAETERGMVFSLSEPVEGVVPKKTLKLERIIESVSDKPVIFVGERHTNYEDHKVELDLIMELFRKGRKFAIGMEMFQRPFQKTIDEYLSGVIDERKFLKESEYFKRWRFDYGLYREIIEFAKVKGIPVVALNLNSEIVNKVASGGLDSLSETEKKEIPQDMDMADATYKKRLKDIFEGHPSGTTFDNFYQAQILWDETMAHSAAQFLKEKPDYQIVILAGAGHIMYDSGIPRRLQRLTGKEYATLINGQFDEDIGDYVLFANEIKPPFSARLGVMLDKREGGVIIEEFSPGSAALRAGLERGDTLISIDDWKIESVEDAKIALFDKKPEQTVKVRIKRKRFLLGEKEFEFSISL